MTEISPDASPRSSPFLVSMGLLLSWNAASAAVFAIVFMGIKVSSEMVGLIGMIMTSLANGLAAIAGFWLANSASSNRSSARKDAVIAQQAGAGPPSPAPAQPVADSQ